jgi:hypothetical protein
VKPFSQAKYFKRIVSKNFKNFVNIREEYFGTFFGTKTASSKSIKILLIGPDFSDENTRLKGGIRCQ